MDPVTIAAIAGAVMGGLSGSAKHRNQVNQQRRDMLANALEAETSWILDPNYQDVTRPGSKQGMILGGMASGGMQGAMLGGMSDWGGGAGAGAGASTMDAGAMASKMATPTAGGASAMGIQSLAPGAQGYTSQLGIQGLSSQAAPGAWVAGASGPSVAPGMTTAGMGGKPMFIPNTSGWGWNQGAVGPSPYDAGGSMFMGRYVHPYNSANAANMQTTAPAYLAANPSNAQFAQMAGGYSPTMPLPTPPTALQRGMATSAWAPSAQQHPPTLFGQPATQLRPRPNSMSYWGLGGYEGF